MKTGCMWCANLKIADKAKLEGFSCVVNASRQLENAGACMVQLVGGKWQVVRECHDFTPEKGALGGYQPIKLAGDVKRAPVDPDGRRGWSFDG